MCAGIGKSLSMFIDNRYAKIYWALIERARERGELKTHKHHSHHVIPKCLGGSNGRENKVLLTIREHYIAHALLVKMTVGDDRVRMISAHRVIASVSGRPIIFKSAGHRSRETRRKEPKVQRALKSIPAAPITLAFKSSSYRKNCFGKLKMTDGKENRTVSPDEAEKLIKIGWRRGVSCKGT